MADEAEPRARIVEIGGRSDALGGSVMLRLAQPFTVLVGRNAVGKSTLLHLIEQFALHAVGGNRLPSTALNNDFQCLTEIGGRRYHYSASTTNEILIPGDSDILWSDSELFWIESCWDNLANTQLWSVKAGVVNAASSKILVPRSAGLLSLDPSHLPSDVSTIAAELGWLFRHATLVPPGLPAGIMRGPIIFVREQKGADFQTKVGTGNPRVDRFALQLMRWATSDGERFDRVGAVLRRIGVCNELQFFCTSTTAPVGFGELLIDNHPLEHVSDGTLRVIEIVVALELAPAGTLVMIEEPETGIHPGLCDRIMAEIEAAAEGLQLIISTHSPRILDGVQYHQLRHVRRNGSTRIDALTPEQVKEVKAFLGHQGTLSDYVFSRDFDDVDDVEED